MNIPHDISGIVPCLVIRFILVIPTTNLFPEAKKNILPCPKTPKNSMRLVDQALHEKPHGNLR